MKTGFNDKTWGDMVDLYKSAYVLPYHVHSWEIAKAIHYLESGCGADPT